MSSSTEQSLAEFIAANGLSMAVEPAESNPNMQADASWHRDASHYLCTIRNGGEAMAVPFSMGAAHTDAPTLEMVLDSLASDAASVENEPDWLEWAGEMGFEDDIDELKDARESHATIVRQAGELRDLLGDEMFEALLWNTERL